MVGSTDPSRRQRILAVLLERIEAIRTANGFNTEAGWAVFLGETPVLGPDDPESAIAIVVGDDVTPYQGENVMVQLVIEFQALAKADINKPWIVVEAMLADIKRAIELEDRTLGRLVPNKIERGPSRTLPRVPGSTTVGASLTYIAPYLERWGHP